MAQLAPVVSKEGAVESPPGVGSAPTYVVGIGASAGGLEALEHFFDNVPTKTGMAFVVVQHLSPDFKSLMDEILARRTPLPISLVEDAMVVEGDHIYLIPPKKEMIISAGRLLLSERDREQELTLPIDVFFRSLAQDCGGRAIAVVLSGGGSDGSRGIRAVHEAGGLVVIQDVESAQFDGMPKTAREAGVADYVLPPQDMPGVLIEHASRAGIRPVKPSEIEPGMSAVYRMLEQEFGIDFTHYKPSTITRRIERRLQLARVDDIDEYVQKLSGEHKELDVLYRDLLIGVTRFFRNEEAFEVLEKEVLPDLLNGGSNQSAIPGLGGWLRDGRGGLFAGDHPERADCRNGAAVQDFRDGRAPGFARASDARAIRRRSGRQRLARALETLLFASRQKLSGGA